LPAGYGSFSLLRESSATIMHMQSNKTSSSLIRRNRRCTSARAFQAVRISKDLIAFYPNAIHRPQPYVILLDPASGILKRLDLLPNK
jgi:hypothetical protein